MKSTFQIDQFNIGAGHPTFVVAEISANHCQSFDRAAKLIVAAKEAGADAVKLQTYTADTLTIDCDADEFLIRGTIWNGQKLYDLYNQAHTPWEWHPKLMEVANDVDLLLFSSPFDATAVDFLEQLHVPVYKIASFEIGDLALLKKIALTGKPIILSTGMATQDEIELAIETLRQNHATEIALLKCTSAYPAALESMNLKTIRSMIETYGCPCGLSDHSLTHDAAMASVCLGGSIIEKHLALSREDGGPDAGFSLEPHEFAEMVAKVRDMETVLGRIQYGPSENDIGNRVFRRSLFVVKDVKAGETFTSDNIRSIRPGHGLEPRFLEDVIDRQASHTIERGTPLCWNHVANPALERTPAQTS